MCLKLSIWNVNLPILFTPGWYCPFFVPVTGRKGWKPGKNSRENVSVLYTLWLAICSPLLGQLCFWLCEDNRTVWKYVSFLYFLILNVDIIHAVLILLCLEGGNMTKTLLTQTPLGSKLSIDRVLRILLLQLFPKIGFIARFWRS